MSALRCPLATPTVLLGFLLPWTWGISSRLLLTLDEGYLLTTAPPDLERGIAPLGPPAPAQPPLLGRGVAPLSCSCAVAAWHSRPLPLTSEWGSSSWLPPLGHGVFPASAPDLGRWVALLCCTCAPSQPPALVHCRSPNHNHRKLVNLITLGPQPCLTQ